MAGVIDARVVSPDSSLFEGTISEVYARSTEGEIGILAGHQPALLLLAPGPLMLREEGGAEHHFAVRSGFLEFAHNQLTVLADAAEVAADRAAAQRVIQTYAEIDDDAPAPG